jgi:CRISPR/Cas system-associated exonuclease Cas4 (RecB family)
MLHSLIFREVKEARDLNGYIRNILSELMGILKDDQEEKGKFINSAIQAEYIYCLLLSINQLDKIIENSNIEFGTEIFGRILDKVIRKIVVPFSGEPLSGLQVMGILETRLLDFDNLIILSANEGVLPKGSAQNSYIPYNLRVAFGLPTVQHQDSIYAYYFYRLLQRAKKVRFVYNSSSAGLKTGEMSRFLLQLKYSSNLKPEFTDSRFLISPPKKFSESIKRDSRINDIIKSQFSSEGSRGLSPSGINTWINCQMKFYYRYIAKLKEHDDVAIEIDSPLFGNILHEAMSNIYSGFLNREISREMVLRIRDNTDYIKSVVNDSFIKLFHHNKKAKVTGRNIVVVTVLESIIKQILLVDSRMSPLNIIGLERRYNLIIPLKQDNKTLLIPISGIIDRVDVVSGVTRILDYKSGNDNLSIRQFSDLFSYNTKDRNSAAFQTLLYCELYICESTSSIIRPSLYPVRQIFSDGFTDQFVVNKGEHAGAINNYLSLRDDFIINLKKVLTDIVNPYLDIEMTSDRQKCKYCPYAPLCDREE